MLRFQSFLLLILVCVLLIFAGCSGNKSKLPEKADISASVQWWGSQSDDGYVYLYGEAVDKSESISKENAKANALSATQYIEAYITSILSNIEMEASIKDTKILESSQKVIKLVSNILFSQAVSGKSETIMVSTVDGESYKTFMQVKIPKMIIDKNLVYQIRNDENLYNRFIESGTFNALDERVD